LGFLPKPDAFFYRAATIAVEIPRWVRASVIVGARPASLKWGNRQNRFERQYSLLNRKTCVAGTATPRSFPQPWLVDEHPESFIVRDETGRALGYFYYDGHTGTDAR
jgi:hypothetical protein